MAEDCNILIIESDQKTVEILVSLLKKWKCRVSYVKSGLNVLSHLQNKEYQLVILSDSLPEEDGFRILRRIKESGKYNLLPVILMLSDKKDSGKVFVGGGTDYIIKPFSATEISARLNPYIKNQQILNRYKIESDKKEQAVRQLDEAIVEMEVMSRIDPLTSILNRRTLLDKVSDEQIRSRRNKKSFSLLLADIVNCRRYNERFGYECGDYIIKQTASILDTIVRERDFTSRWRGDQFMILFPETDKEGIEIIIKKISERLKDVSFYSHGIDHNVSLIFSSSTCSGTDDIDEIILDIEDCLEKSRNMIKIKK